MKISIIIPTLNEQFYLPKLLAALEKQTFRDFEVTVVDGGSGDKTVFEATRFVGRLNLKIIEDQRGISRQRNLGARESQGEYLLFLDADVVPSPAFLEILLREVERKKIDAGIAFPRPLAANPWTRIMATVGGICLFSLLFPIYKNCIGADFVVRRKAFEKVGGFDESLLFAEDNDLLQRLLKSGFSYKVLYKPKIKMSLRRFERDGYLRYTLRTLFSMILISLFGIRRTQKIVRFEFGHHRPPKG